MSDLAPHVWRVSAPGRICLFGEHQDYLGLPVIASAINRRITVEARLDLSAVSAASAAADAETVFSVTMPDLDDSLVLYPNLPQNYSTSRDYLRSALSVLQREGARWSHSLQIVLHGDIPINAGVSSSSAMVVAWLRFLLATRDHSHDPLPSGKPVDREEIARWGFQTEVCEFGESGGMMDHYCAALGGVITIDTRPPFQAETLPVSLEGLVLGHSHEPKATVETIVRTRKDVSEGVVRLKRLLPDFDLFRTPLAVAESYLHRIDAQPARRIRANLVNRDITPRARKALEERDFEALGQLLLLQHAQLRDGLDLSTPKIERMLGAAMEAGALGGKVNGSGGGGTMYALAPGREAAVAAAIAREGGSPFEVRVDDGVRLENSAYFEPN